MILLLAAALAAEPIEVPLMVPAVPAVPVADAPGVTAFGWTSVRAAGFRVNGRLGQSILVAPFREVLEDTRCACDAEDLTCALLDDGSVSVRLGDPTRQRPRAELGTCTLGGHALRVVGAPPVLPPPWEAEPGRWAVPVRAGGTAAGVDVLWLPDARAWTADPATCTVVRGSRGSGVLRLSRDADAGFVPCATRRGGARVEVRTVPYRMPWEEAPDR